MVVEPPSRRQQSLTDHQRERLRERREGIPAMYNALDPSQDFSQSTAHPTLPDRYAYIHCMLKSTVKPEILACH